MDVDNWERLFKILANRRRLRIIKSLSERREMPVSAVAKGIRLSFRSTSKHLRILKTGDLVENEQRSLQVYYRLNSDLPLVVRYFLETTPNSNSRE
jgi:DNA-binding transcriptional ArsR family regulator